MGDCRISHHLSDYNQANNTLNYVSLGLFSKEIVLVTNSCCNREALSLHHLTMPGST